jgi:hypothetical protein
MKGLMYKSVNRYVLIKISAVTNHTLGRPKRKDCSKLASTQSQMLCATTVQTISVSLLGSENAYLHISTVVIILSQIMKEKGRICNV